LRAHEAADEKHIFTPEAAAADHAVIDAWSRGDHASVLEHLSNFMAFKPEGRFGHYQMLVAALGGADCVAPGRAFSDYENAIGTGQIHVWFDRQTTGWTKEAS
jgi:3,4-dihydroxyphenylacetate 2,3-dioxygenase